MTPCEFEFWQNTLKSLKYLKSSKECSLNMDLSDVFKRINSFISFDITCHRGPMRPQYYVTGIPSMRWVCSRCFRQDT